MILNCCCCGRKPLGSLFHTEHVPRDHPVWTPVSTVGDVPIFSPQARVLPGADNTKFVSNVTNLLQDSDHRLILRFLPKITLQ